MIVVTGPGRSGTSLLAQIYRELGFDPGGRWHPDWRAGFEAPEIVEVNRRITRYLGMGSFVQKRPIGKVLRRSLRKISKGRSPLRPRPDTPLAWDRLELAAERFGPKLRELSKSHAVVKDPQFCQTLDVWARAGAEIEHVLVTLRSLDDVVRSSRAAGYTDRDEIVRNTLVYRLGLCVVALHEYGIEHRLVEFPGFVERPDVLFEAMRFPGPVSQEQFSAAFDRVVRPGMITGSRRR